MLRLGVALFAFWSIVGLSVPMPLAFAGDTDPNVVSSAVQFGTYGTALGRMIDPIGVAVGMDDSLYVAECGNSRIQVFDKQGHPPIGSYT